MEKEEVRCICGEPKWQGKPWCMACARILPLLKAIELTHSYDDPEQRSGTVSDEVKLLLETIRTRIRHTLTALGYKDY